jgi:hypothetical protein
MRFENLGPKVFLGLPFQPRLASRGQRASEQLRIRVERIFKGTTFVIASSSDRRCPLCEIVLWQLGRRFPESPPFIGGTWVHVGHSVIGATRVM